MSETFIHGLPHVGAHYSGGVSHGRLNYKRDVDACPICDKARATDVHHLDPIGAGGHQTPENLRTKTGTHPLYTPLIACCRECHSKFHSHEIKLEWRWDDEEAAELWASGWFLAHGYVPHDERLKEFGSWLLDGEKL